MKKIISLFSVLIVVLVFAASIVATAVLAFGLGLVVSRELSRNEENKNFIFVLILGLIVGLTTSIISLAITDAFSFVPHLLMWSTIGSVAFYLLNKSKIWSV